MESASILLLLKAAAGHSKFKQHEALCTGLDVIVVTVCSVKRRALFCKLKAQPKSRHEIGAAMRWRPPQQISSCVGQRDNVGALTWYSQKLSELPNAVPGIHMRGKRLAGSMDPQKNFDAGRQSRWNVSFASHRAAMHSGSTWRLPKKQHLWQDSQLSQPPGTKWKKVQVQGFEVSRQETHSPVASVQH